MRYEKIKIIPADKVEEWLSNDEFEEAKITITPQLAAKFLAKQDEYNENHDHPLNREIRTQRAETYAADMKHGDWNDRIGDPIRFNKEGLPIDCQHRFMAQVLSGCSKVYRAIKGLTQAEQSDIDQHGPRLLPDFFSIVLGKNYGVQRASLVKNIASLFTSKNRRIHTHAAVKINKMFESEMNLVFKHSSKGLKRALRITPVLGPFAIASKLFPREMEKFIDGYFTGNNLTDGNPIKTLRHHILDTGRPNFTNPERRQLSLFTMNILRHYILDLPIKRKIKDLLISAEGLDFFISKTPKIREEIKDLFTY